MHAHERACTHAHTHTHSHTYTHAHAHTTHTYTHMHTYVLTFPVKPSMHAYFQLYSIGITACTTAMGSYNL